MQHSLMLKQVAHTVATPL